MKIALIMIVKNESSIIERCLNSTLPLVDTFLIIDTGSHDDTISKIFEVAARWNKTGEVLQRPWINFGHNRTELLSESRSRCDFSLMIDADDYISGALPALDSTCDGYQVQCEMNNLRFYRPHLFNSNCLWKFMGVLHEYATGGKAVVADSLVVHARCEGVRSKNPNKYLDDALMLEHMILLQPDQDKARHVFYCAQSYRDAGYNEMAKRFYLMRTTLGNWTEEIYVSYLNLIRLSISENEKKQFAWKGIQINPNRKEIPYHILSWFRQRDIYCEEVFSMAYTHLENTENSTFLFQENDAYGWSYYDEFGLYAYYMKRFGLAKQMFRRCILICPPDHIRRLQDNLQFV
jgi:glycosyltransferase involved in cell wall biosynthesis